MVANKDDGNGAASSGAADASRGSARDRAAGAYNAARDRTADAYHAARDRTYSAYETARGRAADVTRQATDQISVYPVSAVIGGLAIGALVGLLLPATKRENDLLGSTGRRLTGAARDAAQRGIDAGKERIGEIRDRATKKVGEAVVEAVSSVGKG